MCSSQANALATMILSHQLNTCCGPKRSGHCGSACYFGINPCCMFRACAARMASLILSSLSSRYAAMVLGLGNKVVRKSHVHAHADAPALHTQAHAPSPGCPQIFHLFASGASATQQQHKAKSQGSRGNKLQIHRQIHPCISCHQMDPTTTQPQPNHATSRPNHKEAHWWP